MPKPRNIMLQIQRIRQESEAVIEGLKKRGIDASKTVHALIELDAKPSCHPP
jgi:seryl-tRNA synthetase